MLSIPPELFYLDSFRRLAERIAAEHERQDAVARATHGRFNVFTTILQASDEVRLHTRFLCCLLDPDALHDCGTLFLDLFFATLAEVPPLDHHDAPFAFTAPPGGPGWRVKKEFPTALHGQLDLLIERSSACGFVIENKIYAGEQSRQIARYAGYLEGRHYQDAAHVFFLTLDGRPSVTHEEKQYLRISYSDHVLAWLEKCLAATYAFVPVNQVLLQYREVVRLVTGKTLDRQAMNTVSEFICSHPEIVRHWQEITEGIGGARALFLDRLEQGIGNELAEAGFSVRLRAELIEGRFGSDPNGAFIITPPDNSLYRVPFEIWVEHVKKWQDAVIIGIESRYKKAPLSTADQDVLARMNASLTADANGSGYQKVDPRATWDETWWPVGSHNLIYPFDDAKLAELLARPLAEVAREYAGEIRLYIRRVAAAYDEATRESMIRIRRAEP